MLRISAEVLNEIITHAWQDAPIEACGYLAEKGGVVDRVFRLTNADASTDHYSLVPAEQFAAVREMRSTGHRLCGVYHSHPASPARMSEEDLRLAADPTLAYVIVSLAASGPVVRAFTVNDGLPAPLEMVVAQAVAAEEER